MPNIFLVKMSAVCCTLLPHNTYTVPQQYKSPPVAVNIDFHGHLQYPYISLVWTVHHWKPCRSLGHACFLGHCWYATHTQLQWEWWTKACCVYGTVSVRWDKCSVAMCWHVNQGCLSGQGLGRCHSDSMKKTWPSGDLVQINPQWCKG